MKTILVTGATGYLGSRLVKVFDSAEYQLIILKRKASSTDRIAGLAGRAQFIDLDQTSVEAVFEQYPIDIVLHAATTYSTSLVHNASVIASNLTLPLQLLETGYRHQLKCFINIDTIIDNRRIGYSLSKQQFREWLQLYAPHLVAINVSLANFYGPHDDRTKFFACVLDKLLTNADHIDLTSGEQKRDYVYIDDVTAGFEAVMQASSSFENGYHHFEVGTGSLVEIREVVARMKELSGNSDTELRFGVIAQRECEVMVPSIDLSAIHALGWQARYDLAEGISKTIAAERAR